MKHLEVESLLSKLKGWIAISDFLALLDDYFSSKRTKEEIEHYRLGKGRGSIKKLKDEVVPVSRFLRATRATGDIRFELSDAVPDCWFRPNAQAMPYGLEVTRAHAAEAYWLATEANAKGIGRGFLGLPPTAKKPEYLAALLNDPQAYSTGEALAWVKSWVLSRIKEKNEPKYSGF